MRIAALFSGPPAGSRLVPFAVCFTLQDCWLVGAPAAVSTHVNELRPPVCVAAHGFVLQSTTLTSPTWVTLLVSVVQFQSAPGQLGPA